jgi:hypothetical protein
MDGVWAGNSATCLGKLTAHKEWGRELESQQGLVAGSSTDNLTVTSAAGGREGRGRAQRRPSNSASVP